MLSKIFTHWLFPVVTCAVLLTVHIGDSTPVEILRLKQFDLLQQTDAPSRSADIGIVTIDEKAISKYGQFPWKRDVLADIIWKLREAGANIIVLPILMAETDRLGGDEDLADALYQNGIVIAQVGSGQVNRGGMGIDFLETDVLEKGGFEDEDQLWRTELDNTEYTHVILLMCSIFYVKKLCYDKRIYFRCSLLCYTKSTSNLEFRRER